MPWKSGVFFLSQNEKKPPAKVIPAGSVASRNLKGKAEILGSSRDPRVTDSKAAPFTPPVNMGFQNQNSNIRVRMDLGAPRPTRKFHFVWKPNKQTLRITKTIGEARQAQWMPLRHKAVGLAQPDPLKGPTTHLPLESGSDQPIGKTTEEKIFSTEEEASSPVSTAVELQMLTHGGCDPPIASPVVLDDTASPSSVNYEVGETSGVDHDGESVDSESVRVDLADAASDLGLVMVGPTSVGEYSEDPTLML